MDQRRASAVEPVREQQPGAEAARELEAVPTLPGVDRARIGAGAARIGTRAERRRERGRRRRRRGSIPIDATQRPTRSLSWLPMPSRLPYARGVTGFDCGRHHLPEQRDRAGVLDRDRDEPADQPLGPVEHDDPVAGVRPVSCPIPSVAVVITLAPRRRLARPSTRTSTVRPTNARLSSRLIAVWTASSSLFRRRLTSSGTSSTKSVSAFVPCRGLYLKMKLFLNRARSTSRTDFSNDASVSPQKPTMKSLETATSGTRRADPPEHVVVKRDRVHPLHPLEHLVAAALRGDVQVARDPGQVADGLEQVVGHVVGEVGDELDPLDRRRCRGAAASRSERRTVRPSGSRYE